MSLVPFTQMLLELLDTQKYGYAAAPAEVRNYGMTVPKMIAEFGSGTGIDTLAVFTGTVHGIYSSAPVIDFDRAEEIVKNRLSNRCSRRFKHPG